VNINADLNRSIVLFLTVFKPVIFNSSSIESQLMPSSFLKASHLKCRQLKIGAKLKEKKARTAAY